MARRFLFYASRKYNKILVIIDSEYLYRLLRHRDISCKYNRGLVITGSKYL